MIDSGRPLFAERLKQALDCHRGGDLDRALEIYGELHAESPNHPALLASMGAALMQGGRTSAGLALLSRSLQLKPDQPHAICNASAGLCKLQQFDAALALIDGAYAANADLAAVHFQRGVVRHHLVRLHGALASFDRAIELDERFVEAYVERSIVRHDLSRSDDALADLARAIALRPDCADAHYNRGIVLQDLQRLDQAIASYDRALALNAGISEAYNNRGRALRALNRLEEALASYECAIALDPDFARAFNNKGVALKALRRLQEARASYERALELQPEFADARFNLALLHLLEGNYQEGWRLYESRWAFTAPRSFEQPLWLGAEPLAGRTLLIHAEQGLGDAIQFCRYIPLLTHRECRVIIEAPRALIRLLTTLQIHSDFVERGSPLPDFDLHCPVMSLPLAFETTIESIPAVTPYLFADSLKVDAFRDLLGAKARLRVGLAWSGGPAHEHDRERSLELASLDPLLNLPVDFHSLQKFYRDADIASMRRHPRIRDHHGHLADFSDTAALIAHMDLVISVDTSVAHLAGALGSRVWILLPHDPDFRWLLDRSDSPWYPSATLFRQAAAGDWQGTIERARDSLATMAANCNMGVTGF